MSRNTRLWLALACAAMLLQAPRAVLGAQQQPGHPPRAGGPPSADMPARCQAVMADRQKMMEEAKAADARLDELVSKMNAASGQEKADATAAVVSEMVAQRKAMRSRMMGMQQEMMAHTMEHMQAGPQSMASCPMMKGMGRMQGMDDVKP